MNDTSAETVDKAEALLKEIRGNVYSFETDSGKADMVTGKILANLQWSGDGVYALDQAEEDGVYLNWATPRECTNLWFDGWVMLKSGIDGDADKKHAAEAFINFMSRTDNVVRNMYYIGYTSVIAGGESPLVYEYAEWCYGAEDDEEAVIEYPVGYFFSGNAEDEDYVIIAPEEQQFRQLSAQYPKSEVIARSAVMGYFDKEANEDINQMWINIRCFNLSQITAAQWRNAGIVIIVVAGCITLFALRKKIFRK
jgi:spermidine/putrescine transport system substrate-binding protein